MTIARKSAMKQSEPRVLLLYPPNQSWPGTMCKPNGSLAYPSLGGALIGRGFGVEVYDACVGNADDDLRRTFFNPVELESGLLRTGVTDDRILEKVEPFDIIGITSIFSDQESMVLRTARLIRAAYPDKLLISGGVNARSRVDHFVRAGFSVVCLSEAESTILQLVERVARRDDFEGISGIAVLRDDEVKTQPALGSDMVWDLDQLPIPAWHLLPNERYWEIGRPHGGHFPEGTELRYASMMTSLGCPFHCAYCHIAGEVPGSLSGAIGRYRIKSDERVLTELEELRKVGVRQVFIEDDSLLGNKRRSLRLLTKIRGAGFDILDVNGVNVIHLLRNHAPDVEVIEALVEAGFKEITLPFETGNQRIMRKYASNTLDLERSDIQSLIEVCKRYRLRITGNYMLGYPDETRAEIEQTINMARHHMSYGLDAANFFLVMPLPGTPLFDQAIREGYLPADYSPDRMNWTKANMKNTEVPPSELEEIRDRAWAELNSREFVAYKRGMSVPRR
jgi:radical SAM superfamily enzyme YgiQ (UPF0313 family)